jgi:hypothetical protein
VSQPACADALQRRAWYENSSLWVSWMQPSRTSTRPYVSDSNTCGELLPQHTEHCCVQGRALTMTSWKSDFALCSNSFTCNRSAGVTAAAAAGALATTRLQRHRLARPQAPQLGVPAVHDSADPGGLVCRWRRPQHALQHRRRVTRACHRARVSTTADRTFGAAEALPLRRAGAQLQHAASQEEGAVAGGALRSEARRSGGSGRHRPVARPATHAARTGGAHRACNRPERRNQQARPAIPWCAASGGDARCRAALTPSAAYRVQYVVRRA